MSEILELRTGQVAYISSLMCGFALSIAVQVIRGRDPRPLATFCFLLFTISALLFLLALYVDVSLILRLAGVQLFTEPLIAQVVYIRNFSTTGATAGVLVFLVAIGITGWLRSSWAGWVSTVIMLVTLIAVGVAREIIVSLPVP
ncbi:hypothetical protein [Parendozoicomonas sp. Alg238-R29]|uniref:hypothetical protein n=1 Tax=Parendozoicomonas sp. Alg238-R29 TaxID=2993446 RepID=UPI00248F1B7B|nr:hypothetical protein [Parendozoicomonas sp. Alg238-R29]